MTEFQIHASFFLNSNVFHLDTILENAKEKDVVFLVVGDPLGYVKFSFCHFHLKICRRCGINSNSPLDRGHLSVFCHWSYSCPLPCTPFIPISHFDTDSAKT